MDIKKISSGFFLSAALCLFLCSCAERTFLAASADFHKGGLFTVSPEGRVSHALYIPRLNYLIRSQKNPHLYYGTLNYHPRLKTVHGAVVLARKLQNNSFSHTQTVSAEGKTPCHLTLSPDHRFLYTANYSSGDISELRLAGNGSILPGARLIRYTGRSVTSRQKGPHPHYVSFDPAGKQLYVCDLGTDEIRIFDYTPGKGVKASSSAILKLPPGAGVRHLAFAPDGNTLYTANELDSTSSSFLRKDSNSPWKRIKTIKTRKPSQKMKKNYPGAIRITPDGKYFFITNRGEDSIAVFKTLPKGDFVLLDTFPSGGSYPSDIMLFPDGKRIAVIHLKTNNITFFDLDGKTGKLSLRKEKVTLKKGMSLTW